MRVARGSKAGPSLRITGGDGDCCGQFCECDIHHRFGWLEGRHAPQRVRREKDRDEHDVRLRRGNRCQLRRAYERGWKSQEKPGKARKSEEKRGESQPEVPY